MDDSEIQFKYDRTRTVVFDFDLDKTLKENIVIQFTCVILVSWCPDSVYSQKS